MKEKNENKKRRSDLIKQLLQEYQPKSAADLQNMLKDLLGKDRSLAERRNERKRIRASILNAGLGLF